MEEAETIPPQKEETASSQGWASSQERRIKVGTREATREQLIRTRLKI